MPLRLCANAAARWSGLAALVLIAGLWLASGWWFVSLHMSFATAAVSADLVQGRLFAGYETDGGWASEPATVWAWNMGEASWFFWPPMSFEAGQGDFRVGVNLFFLFLGTGVLVAIACWRRVPRPRRCGPAGRKADQVMDIEAKRCPICGYDVRLLSPRVCPECGTNLDEYRPPRPSLRNPLLVVLGTTILIMVSSGTLAVLEPHTFLQVLVPAVLMMLVMTQWIAWIWLLGRLYRTGDRLSIWGHAAAFVLGTAGTGLTLLLGMGSGFVLDRWLMSW